jgi:hypothetical protein
MSSDEEDSNYEEEDDEEDSTKDMEDNRPEHEIDNDMDFENKGPPDKSVVVDLSALDNKHEEPPNPPVDDEAEVKSVVRPSAQIVQPDLVINDNHPPPPVVPRSRSTSPKRRIAELMGGLAKDATNKLETASQDAISGELNNLRDFTNKLTPLVTKLQNEDWSKRVTTKLQIENMMTANDLPKRLVSYRENVSKSSSEMSRLTTTLLRDLGLLESAMRTFRKNRELEFAAIAAQNAQREKQEAAQASKLIGKIDARTNRRMEQIVEDAAKLATQIMNCGE